MNAIWKFPLEIEGEQVLQMPLGSEILCAQVQEGRLCLWAIVDSEMPRERRTIVIVGTGHPMGEPADYDYIGTAQMNGGALVWHVFERL